MVGEVVAARVVAEMGMIVFSMTGVATHESTSEGVARDSHRVRARIRRGAQSMAVVLNKGALICLEVREFLIS